MPIRPRSGRLRTLAPQKIVLEFDRIWMLGTEHLTTLGIDPGHDMLDGAVFSRCVHCLKDQQDGITIGCVEQLLL